MISRRSSGRSNATSTRRSGTTGTSPSAGSTCSPRCSGSAVGPARRTWQPDRLEEEGWVARHRHVDTDRRAVEVELTRTGRRLWREMNVTYRRSLQERVGVRLDDEQVAALREIIELLPPDETNG